MFALSNRPPLSLYPICRLSKKQSAWKRPVFKILDIMKKLYSRHLEKTFKAYVIEGKTMKIQLKNLI